MATALAAAPVAALAAGRPGHRAAPTGRVVGTFLMRGRIVTALRVPGERRGQAVVRHWRFTGRGCSRISCRRLVLHRDRTGGLVSSVTLVRTGRGRWAGRGRFDSALECRGAIYPRGEVVLYRITVRVTRAVRIQGIRFARRIAATYSNPRRIDRTICPLGPSRDAARYRGSAPVPGPPHPAFTAAAGATGTTATFSDTSAPGEGGAAVRHRLWQFGDPGSGAADTAIGTQPSHTFTVPGTYQVTLTVADANGLRASVTQPVTVPAPPAIG